jgi:predicted kinase
LVGSLGRGDGDAYSDVDLVVAVNPDAPATVFHDPVDGLGLPGTVLYHRPKPSNAPKGGAYLAIGIDLAGLPMLVDIFVWPAATAAVPAGARVLLERDRLPRSEMSFVPLLDAHRSDDQQGSDPEAPGTVLMLVQLAAKYLARGNRERLAGICSQLGIDTETCNVNALRDVLSRRLPTHDDPYIRPAVDAALRLLGHVDESVVAAAAVDRGDTHRDHLAERWTPMTTAQPSPSLLVLRGNSGSGKSTIAEALQKRYGRGLARISLSHRPLGVRDVREAGGC